MISRSVSSFRFCDFFLNIVSLKYLGAAAPATALNPTLIKPHSQTNNPNYVSFYFIVLLVRLAILLAPALILTIIKLKTILDHGRHDADTPVVIALEEEPKKLQRDKRRVKYRPQENVKEHIINHCVKLADNSFMKLAKTITFGSKYESLYLNVRQLQCVFVSIQYILKWYSENYVSTKWMIPTDSSMNTIFKKYGNR